MPEHILYTYMTSVCSERCSEKLWYLCKGADIQLSVEETEPIWLQSSVRPYFSEYGTYDLWDTDEEAGPKLVTILQPSEHEEERGNHHAGCLDEPPEINNHMADKPTWLGH